MRRICLVAAICLAALPVFAQDGGGGNGDPPPAEPAEVPQQVPPGAPEPVPPEPEQTPPAETPPAEEQPAEEAPAEQQPSGAKTGKIAGVVIDAKTGEAIIEAQVTVVQTKKKVLTDIDGNYEVKLPPGTYDLRVFGELRTARRISKIVVEAGKTTRIDVQLGGDEEKIAVQEVVVTARPDTATEAVQIVRRQKAAVVQDGVSAEQISRTPDSNAGEAVKRVVSATVQDNKYIVVRGLGGRYSNTLLNGVSLPSPDPDNPSVPLDLFPAALLANLTVSKSFSPDIPGNFAGGSLQIETREFPPRFKLSLRMQTSLDTQTTFNDTQTSTGGGLDFLGYDDGTRELPSSVPRRAPLVVSQGGMTQADVDNVGKQFPLTWNTKEFNAVPNASFAGTVGDTLSLGGDKRLGYLATANYGHRWARREIESRTLFQDGSVRELFNSDWGQEIANLGVLGNGGLALSPTQRLGLVTLYTHSADNTAQTRLGRIDLNAQNGRRTRFRFVERGLWFSQLTGEHALGQRATLNWQGNISLTNQDEPDTRDLLYLEGSDGVFRLPRSQPQSADRTYVELQDWSGGGGIDATYQLERIKLKVGGAAQLTRRSFDGRRFRFNANDVSSSDTLSLPANDLFAPQMFGQVHVSEATRPDDAYDFDRNVFAGYALADVATFDPLRVVAGARIESAFQRLVAGSIFSQSPPPDPVERDDLHVLPSVNLIYGLGSGMNVRASYSMTLARPQLRELAPYAYFDPTRNRQISGNPSLKTTLIHNADLRWEWFFGATELVAASVFYKRFVDPIEQVAINDQNDLGYRNGIGANSFGGELELRASGGRITKALDHLRFGANMSIVYSRIEFDPNDQSIRDQTNQKRPLQGQSPYVANVNVGYNIPSTGTDIDLLYNVFGPRIAEVGILGYEDVKERPFHRLDLTVTQRLERTLILKASGSNLLNQNVRFQQGSFDVLKYKPGIAVLVSLEWAYDRGKE